MKNRRTINYWIDICEQCEMIYTNAWFDKLKNGYCSEMCSNKKYKIWGSEELYKEYKKYKHIHLEQLRKNLLKEKE